MAPAVTADRIDFLQARRVLLLGDQGDTDESVYAAYDAWLQGDGHEVCRYNGTLDPFLGRTSMRWQLRYLADEAQGVAVIPDTGHPESVALARTATALGLPVFDAHTRLTVRAPGGAFVSVVRAAIGEIAEAIDSL